MLVINVREGESIEHAVKRYNRKHRRVGLMKRIRERKHYDKPSVVRRNEIKKAIYKEKYLSEN
ncbi:MAG: 30S ribosomal protein S21 [Saprospiraceae bacterium]|nr:30S ribosomal protein S21 [Saprospiraceae bacterium]